MSGPDQWDAEPLDPVRGGFNYDPFNWYWIVGDKVELGVFSSARGTYMPLDDPTYKAWTSGGGLGNGPTQIVSEAELVDVLQPYGLTIGEANDGSR